MHLFTLTYLSLDMNFKLNLSSASRENLKGLLTVFLGTEEESKRRLGKLIDCNLCHPLSI